MYRAEVATVVTAFLAAVPELAVLCYAVRVGRPDIGCAVALGSMILNLASMASMDLVGVQAAAYRLENPGAVLVIALVSTEALLRSGQQLELLRSRRP